MTPQRAGSDIVVSDHQHVRDLLELGTADPLAQLIVGVNDIDAEALVRQTLDHLGGVRLVSVGDRQHPCLHRREPCREGAGVVLEQHTEEPLDRAEQGSVQHDRQVPSVVGPYVLQLESGGHVEVVLDRAELPCATIASRTSMSIFGP